MQGHNNWGGAGPGAGRPRGSVFDGGPSPKILREAMIEGAVNSKWAKDPADPDAPGTLEMIFRNIAKSNIGVFCSLFARLIPRHTTVQNETSIDISTTYRSTAEVKEAMLGAGMSVKQIAQLESLLPNTDDIEIGADEGIKRKDADEQND